VCVCVFGGVVGGGRKEGVKNRWPSIVVGKRAHTRPGTHPHRHVVICDTPPFPQTGGRERTVRVDPLEELEHDVLRLHGEGEEAVEKLRDCVGERGGWGVVDGKRGGCQKQ
jgi:hypothetical protein